MKSVLVFSGIRQSRRDCNRRTVSSRLFVDPQARGRSPERQILDAERLQHRQSEPTRELAGLNTVRQRLPLDDKSFLLEAERELFVRQLLFCSQLKHQVAYPLLKQFVGLHQRATLSLNSGNFTLAAWKAFYPMFPDFRERHKQLSHRALDDA